jgi:hypothetical protein
LAKTVLKFVWPNWNSAAPSGRIARHERSRSLIGRIMLRWREVRLAKTVLKFVWPNWNSGRPVRTHRAAQARPLLQAGRNIKMTKNIS